MDPSDTVYGLLGRWGLFLLLLLLLLVLLGQDGYSSAPAGVGAAAGADASSPCLIKYKGAPW